MVQTKRSLLERLNNGGVICGEGYVFELERRGYVQAGAFVPEVVLKFPEAVANLHTEFVRAGSDVIEALTYYAHREKLRVIGKEDILEPMHRKALEIAKTAAAKSEGEPPLVAGNICNTNLWDETDANTTQVKEMFEEQVAWAKEAEVDFIVGETFSHIGEAKLALQTIKKAGLPAVITLGIHRQEKFLDRSIEEGVKELEEQGADVVGLNCMRGPATLMHLLDRIRTAVKCHVAALPVPYRTTKEHPTFQSLQDVTWHHTPENRPFPTALDSFTCNRYEIGAFAKEAYEKGICYLGVCCGGAPHHVRAIAEALGRTPPASEYSPDMSKHFAFGKLLSVIPSEKL